jgi:hypothetical protein
MAAPSPRGLLDGLVGACFGLLLAAIALYVAVGLIKAIWPLLLLILIVIGLLAAGIAALRHRDRGW